MFFGATVYLHGKEMNFDISSHQIQKLIQNGS